MKKRMAFLLAFMLLVMAVFSVPLALIHENNPGSAFERQKAGASEDTFVLPASLQFIGQDAFADTAVTAVYMPDQVTEIESGAFADNARLQQVYIPQSAQVLGQGIFSGTDQVTVFGVLGSEVFRWARNNGITFVSRNIWETQIHDYFETANRLLRPVFLTADEWMDDIRFEKPADRKIGEGPVLRWKERAEFHAQDGYFP